MAGVVRTSTKAAAKPNQFCMWVAPTFAQTVPGWRLIKRMWLPVPGVSVRESLREIALPNGSILACKTGEDPDSLRGFSPNHVTLDEIGVMKRAVWEEGVRPALGATMGSADFIGTPKGRDLFWELAQRGDDPQEPDWATLRFASWDSPYFRESRVELERQSTDAVFRQEFLAEFVDHEGQVFRFVREAATRPVSEPEQGRRYFGFADLASVVDFNAIAVLEQVGNRLVQVYGDRWTRVPVDDSLARIRAVAKRYGLHGNRANFGIDATGLGGDFAHQWLRDLAPAGTKFTSELKVGMVRHLQALLEHRRIGLLSQEVPYGATQYAELLDYTGTQLPSGGVRYSHPEGRHDDTVTALMGAAWLAKEQGASPRDILQALGSRY